MRRMFFTVVLTALTMFAIPGAAVQVEITLPEDQQAVVSVAAVNDYSHSARITLEADGFSQSISRSQKTRYRTLPDAGQGIALAITVDGNQAVKGTLLWQEQEYAVLGRVDAKGVIQVTAGESLRQAALRSNLEIESDERSIPTPAHIAKLASGQSLFSLRGSGLVAEAIVAVDTDNEFLASALFNNDSTLASEWIADMFNAMNLVFERDLGVTLVQGETILRIGNNDPWLIGGSPASQAQLNEFGNWWQQNQSGIERTFALLLSGKSSSPNSASGIAWLDGYCENQSIGGGYSINQVFTNPAISVSNASKLVAHELGHNFGSPHTHCYTPEIDQCFNAESGCFSGPPVCPTAGNGTLMSYCNFGPPAGANCGQTDYEFAPRVVDLITTLVAENLILGCLTPADSLIFLDGFEQIL